VARKISHDQNFKNLILDYPLEALALFAGEEAPPTSDAVKVTPLRQEQLKERLGDRFRELDVPLMVEWPDGRREALLFVLEEETNPRRFSIHRLAHYCLDLAELYSVERVVPVVIFLADGKDIPATLSLGSERRSYLTFSYLRCVLSSLPCEQYWDSDNLVARLNLPNMRWAPENKLRVYAQAIRGLLTLEPDPERQLKYIDFIDIYSTLDDNEMREYTERYPQESTAMASLSERLRQEGREQGVHLGVHQGEVEIIKRQLILRFGPLDEATQSKLEAATSKELEAWAENLLDACSLEEVFTRH